MSEGCAQGTARRAADRENVLRAARIHLEYKALRSRIRASIESAISALEERKLIAVEEPERFAIGAGKDATLSVAALDFRAAGASTAAGHAGGLEGKRDNDSQTRH